jgi:metal-dependent hydrolase (beta-lactamase superfamily II)
LIRDIRRVSAVKERLQKTANYLEEVNPEMIVPLHCTGLKEGSYLRKQLGDIVKFRGVGEMISVR